MANPRPVTYYAPVSPIVAGRWLGLPPTELVQDGIWTWYTDPRAVYVNGATYFMAVDSAGTCRIHKYTHFAGTTESFALSSVGLEVDDHNNGSLIFLADGRIVAFYGMHNDPVIRYRVSTNPEDISAWGAEQMRGDTEGPYSYPTPYILSQDPSKHWLFFRRGADATRGQAYRTWADFGAVPGAISAYTDVLRETGARPYIKSCSDGVKRIHTCYSSAHPAEATYTSIHHYVMELDGDNAPHWYSGGSELTLPFGVSAAERIDDGGNRKRWTSDITIDAAGRPRVLWMRYPNNDGTAIEYWCSSQQADGSWLAVKICDDGAGLYEGEPFYHGGLSFDSNDANRIYLSAPIAGVRQIQEWRTADGGATWAFRRTITSGGTAGAPLKLRPCSPRNHNGDLAVLWCEGSYTTYTNYNTAIKGAG